VELNETSSDKNSTNEKAAKVKNDQTNQVGNQTGHNYDTKANEEILNEKIAVKSPEILGKENPFNGDQKTRLTSNYFCFDCGAVFTTVEDKKQHELLEIERKNQKDLE
jgi:hypothetical protein